MATWADLEAGAPDLAAAGRALLYQDGAPLGFLATVGADGTPRIHPICPTIVGGRLCASIGPSPKRADLLRTGRDALHSFPCTDVDDELMLAGGALPVDDAARERAVLDDLHARGVQTGDGEIVFELGIERALHARYGPRPSWPPVYNRWRAP